VPVSVVVALFLVTANAATNSVAEMRHVEVNEMDAAFHVFVRISHCGAVDAKELPRRSPRVHGGHGKSSKASVPFVRAGVLGGAAFDDRMTDRR
jgi:hypothetical protein